MHVSKYSQKDLKQQQADKAAIIALAVLLGVFLGVALYAEHEENRAMRKLEQRNAARGQDFADYVFDDVKTYVLQNQPSQREIARAARGYNPEFQDKRINGLVQDSTKYANAIVRDAPAIIAKLDGTYINEYTQPGQKKPIKYTDDKSFRLTLRENGNTYTSFDKAMRYVQNQQTLITGPEYRLEISPEEDGGLRRGYEQVPTGRTIVKHYNTSPAYKMKVNIKHLREISKALAYARAVKAQAITNTHGHDK